MTYGKKLSHKPVSYTINTVKLESDYNETKITNALNGVGFKARNEINNHINGVVEVLKNHKNKKLTDEIKKELNIKLKEFNEYIEYIKTIDLNTSNFTKIQDLINGFRKDYCDAVGIKRDGKEDITAENGIGLFELFEVEKEVEKTNEQSEKGSSGTETETNSSTSSENDKTGELQESNTLKWSEIGSNKEYRILVGYDQMRQPKYLKIPHENAQQQVYQISQAYAQKIKDEGFKIEENSSKTFAISDTHGDMGALLEALLRSGVVKFENLNDPCKVIVDPNNPDNKIIIPNLKIKDGCTNKLIILGDIIDRGYHSDSCTMLMKDILRQQKESRKSKNIILTVGNHEDMTITDTNDYQMTIDKTDYKTGDNKDYNTARDVLTSMVEDDEMVFCYYDESSNTIYSHVPFDADNTFSALEFVFNNDDDIKDYFKGINNYDVESVCALYDKINNQKQDLTQEETKLLVDILNKLYKYACKNKNKDLEQIYLSDTINCKAGLLWNRNYTENSFKAIKGPNFVGGHDPKKTNKQPTHEIQQNNTGTIIDIDTDRSYGYTSETKTALVEIESTEDKKIEAKKLVDVNTIKYDKTKTIETINSVEPSRLEDSVEFKIEDIDTYTNKSKKLKTIIVDLTNNTYTSCIEYLKQHNYSKSALSDVILNKKFKENCLFVEYNSQQVINSVWIKSFITQICQQYKKDHNNLDEIYSLCDEIFDVLNDKSLELTDEQKNELKKIKEEYLTQNTAQEETKKTSQTNPLTTSDITPRVQQSNDTLIRKTELKNKIKKLSDVIKIIDKQLSIYNNNNKNKQQLIQNTIDLIKEQKEQLKNDNKKLQKAAILLVILEVYKYYMNEENKFNSVNEVYKMLNNTIKKEVKQIKDLETGNVKLNGAIGAINNILSQKSSKYQSLDSNSITF